MTRARTPRVAVCSVVADAAGANAAGRLVQSLRWFGGTLAAAPVTIVAACDLPAESTSLLRAHGATPHVTTDDWRRVLATVAPVDVDLVLLIACESVMLQDPLPALEAGSLHGLPCDQGVIPDETRRRVATHFGLTGGTFRDYEPGMLAIPRPLLAGFLSRWTSFSAALLTADLLREQPVWRESVAFSLAVATHPGPRVQLPPSMGLAAYATSAPATGHTIDPVIVRGAVLVDGRLPYSPYPFAQVRLELMNRRLAGHPPTSPAPRRLVDGTRAQVLVLGMHRSGTSVLTGLLASTGLYAGEDDDFPPADAHNQQGYWERRDVWAIDETILRVLGAQWDDPRDGDLAALPADARALLAERARRVVDALDRRGPWVVKDPRLCTLLPFWLPWLSRPIAVLLYRDPFAVARSLAARDGLPLARGLTLWERYNRAALATSAGLPRLVIAHRDLLEDPRATLRWLLSQLALPGLHVPDDARVHAQMDRSLVHHSPGAATADPPLSPEQVAILKVLERERAHRFSRPVVP